MGFFEGCFRVLGLELRVVVVKSSGFGLKRCMHVGDKSGGPAKGIVRRFRCWEYEGKEILAELKP